MYNKCYWIRTTNVIGCKNRMFHVKLTLHTLIPHWKLWRKQKMTRYRGTFWFLISISHMSSLYLCMHFINIGVFTSHIHVYGHALNFVRMYVFWVNKERLAVKSWHCRIKGSFKNKNFNFLNLHSNVVYVVNPLQNRERIAYTFWSILRPRRHGVSKVFFQDFLSSCMNLYKIVHIYGLSAIILIILSLPLFLCII